MLNYNFSCYFVWQSIGLGHGLLCGRFEILGELGDAAVSAVTPRSVWNSQRALHSIWLVQVKYIKKAALESSQ